jgi:hypothetical protein
MKTRRIARKKAIRFFFIVILERNDDGVKSYRLRLQDDRGETQDDSVGWCFCMTGGIGVVCGKLCKNYK